ncbi:MAG TPA: hypothetical protein VF877_02640 [Gaiellaceae bacterium]
MGPRLAALFLFLVLALAGCGDKSGSKQSSPAPRPATGAPPWPAPPNPMKLTRKAGLFPERAEFLQYHVHAHLDVFVNGKPIRVPAGIGIDIKDPGVTSEKLADGTTSYGGIELCRRVCISPLHTHDDTGVLHTETKTVQPNRLGQFFTEWAVRLTPECVGGYCKPKAPIAIYVDGQAYDGDPRDIELSDGKEIAIVIGTPPDSIPSEFPQ